MTESVPAGKKRHAPRRAAAGPAARGREGGSRRTETREKILDVAGQLFRARGVDATGIDAVMREAGLTHGGFYLHFPSKEALVAEVARSLLGRAASRWQGIADTVPPDAALRAIVDAYLDAGRVATARCCPLATLGADAARRPRSRAAMAEALRRMLDALARCLPGRRRQDAMVVLSTMVGAVVLARLAEDASTAGAFLDAARSAALSLNGSGSAGA